MRPLTNLQSMENKTGRKKPRINLQLKIKGEKSMFEENELEQIKMRKIQAMLTAAEKTKHQANSQPITLNDNNFNSTVQSHELLVVDFWAPWCGQCRMVGPVIEQLAAEYAGKARFGKLNVDENQMIASAFEVMSIPTIIVFYKGQPVERIVGAYPKTQIETRFKRYLRSY
jgi:thioredoxin 1